MHMIFIRGRCLALSAIGAAVVAAIPSTLGCGGSANGRLEISGKVSLDGTPLDQGVITFASVEGKRPSSGAMIFDGEFHIPDGKGLLPGDYKVAIDSADEGGKTSTPGTYSMVIPLSKIPPKYNTDTTLTARVTLDGENHFVFDLSSRQ